MAVDLSAVDGCKGFTSLADLFCAPKGDAHGAARTLCPVKDLLSRSHGDCDPGPIVNGTRGQIPTVQMAANDHDLFRLFASGNLTHHRAGLQIRTCGGCDDHLDRDRRAPVRHPLQKVRVRI